MRTPKAVADRIPVTGLTPTTPDPRWRPKAFLNEVVPFTATVFREGHDLVGALLKLTSPSGVEHLRRMQSGPPGSDGWNSQVQLNEIGVWRWLVTGFADEISTWRRDAALKIDANVDVELMYQIGANLLERAAADSKTRGYAKKFSTLAKLLRGEDAIASQSRRAVIDDDEAFADFELQPLTKLASSSITHEILVESRRAGFGNWYEFFPRSEGAVLRKDGSWKSGTFRTAQKRLTEIADMGFDVVYLPPIHPIGITNRKGRNNSLEANSSDPGSPWAIGGQLADGTQGGHDSVHPELGTLASFRSFVRKARSLNIDVALDLALQASPDHPWVKEHPEWFTTLPDGTIRFAENPPKKYQDIYPINFDNDFTGLLTEVIRIVRHWINQGVRIFRVDNPHTKPLPFWEQLINTINETDPDIVFLAEAFTRPAMMRALAMVGFQQSYSYFTWRNTKAELEEFITSIAVETADFMRPNLFVNTPDILTEYLQLGGPTAFTIRATLAATIAPNWGVYSGFELFESVARPGSEEAIDNEKYEYKPRDFAGAEQAGRSLALYLGILNRIRADHPSLQQLRNIHLHTTDDDNVIAYSKHLDGQFTDSGEPDTILIIANVDPHSVRETLVHLDMVALGLTPGSDFIVKDLVTDQTWRWGTHNYVRLDAFTHPVHIFSISGLELNQ